jgi:hypothetical protein
MKLKGSANWTTGMNSQKLYNEIVKFLTHEEQSAMSKVYLNVDNRMKRV